MLTGHVVASLARNLVATARRHRGRARSSGFRPDGDAARVARRWSASSRCYILAITYLFAAIGLAASSPEAASGYGFILLFLPYLSSAFVPVETMPEWLQPIAENQPITPIIETIRGPADGHADRRQRAGGRSAGASRIVVVAVVWGGWLFRRKAGRR